MISATFPQRGSQTRRKTDGVLGEVYASNPAHNSVTVRWPTIPGAYAMRECTSEEFERNWELTGVHFDPPRPSILAPSIIAFVSFVFLIYVLTRGTGTRYRPYENSEEEPNDPPATLYSAQALDAKYGVAAAERCAAGADDYLRSIARFRFHWDDSGMFENKFDSFEPNVVSPGVLTLTSNKAKLSDGFGQFRSIELFCNYDTQGHVVLNYASRPEQE